MCVQFGAGVVDVGEEEGEMVRSGQNKWRWSVVLV